MKREKELLLSKLNSKSADVSKERDDVHRRIGALFVKSGAEAPQLATLKNEATILQDRVYRLNVVWTEVCDLPAGRQR